ncbi:MAG: hypothetical protein ABIP48_32615 [Planctomycetota bacterium]
MTTMKSTAGEGSPSQGFNLLKVKPLRGIVLWAGFPYVFQAALLVFFLYLAVLGWGLFPPEGVEGKLYAKTNLVNLLIWGLWWPAMIWIAVWFGRAWCAVCPLELVANGSERLGRAVGLKQWALGKWLRSGALILVLYAVIQMMVPAKDLHRVPAYTSVFLWAVLIVAILTGLWIKDRAFCRGFCPVGLLLGTYGRGSMLVVRPVGDEKCGDCTAKDCAAAAGRDRLDARSCPSLLNPSKLKDNTDCLVCGQCIKACGAKENMGLFLRRPFHAADARPLMASWPVTLFVMLVSGFVAFELFSEWKAALAAFFWVPTTAAESLELAAFEGWLKGVWILLVVPLLLWLVLGVVVVVSRGAGSLWEAWRRLALPLAVVLAAGHMAKGLAKAVSWGGYLPMALSEPTGHENALAITQEAISKPASLVALPVVSVVSLALLLAMFYYALRESRMADAATHRGRIAAISMVGLASAFLILGWGLQ